MKPLHNVKSMRWRIYNVKSMRWRIYVDGWAGICANPTVRIFSLKLCFLLSWRQSPVSVFRS